jgi:uncharacterized lipoprotein NlpE involved in copper resistance
MRKIIYLLVAMMIGSCNFMNQPADDAGNNESKAPDMHNARIALDYYGTYKGVLPCGDCDGIETEVRLSPESFYVRSIRYLGSGDPRMYFSNGEFEWNDAGNTITLIGLDPPNQFFVAENKLIHVDADGQLLKGEMAEKYTLMKQ